MKEVFTFIFFTLIFLIPIVSADMGPKPTVDIYVTYNNQKITDSIFYAKMLACVDEKSLLQSIGNIKIEIPQLNISQFDSIKNCYWYPAQLAWGGEYKDSICNFDYFPPEDFKLAFYIPSLNKIFISNEATRNNFHSTFNANLSPDGTVELKETTSFLVSDASKQMKDFILALILTLVVELSTALIYINWNEINRKRYLKKQKGIMLSIFLANFISLPIVWFVFPLIGFNTLITIFLAEIFAIIFEGIFIYSINKKIFQIKNALILSMIMNIASLFIGGFIYLFLTFLFGIL
jgi:hypothetical protein